MRQKNKYINSSVVLLKRIDYFAGPVLLKMAGTAMKTRADFSVDNEGESREHRNVGRILIIRPGGIGDAVLLIPSLKILRENMQSARIDVLCEPRNKGIFDASPWVDNVLNYRNLKDVLYLAKNHYDIVFDTEQSHFLSAVFVSCFRRALKVGFSTNGRESVYDVAIEYHQNQYEMESFFRLFRSGIKKWPAQMLCQPPFFMTSHEERAKVDCLTKGIKKPVACIFPGASIKQRHWPVERWADVADSLREKGFHVIVLGGKGERNIVFEIVERACYPVTNLCCRLSLNQTTVLFEKASVLISTDSGILHLGVLSGLPTVSLFGPGIAEKWGPVGNNHIILNKKLACSPCTRFGETPPCPSGGKCMDEIKVDDVVNAVSKLVDLK